MLDDNIAFALMADNATAHTFGKRVPLLHKLAYILPYATFHESRANWRPLFFAKYDLLYSISNITTHSYICISVYCVSVGDKHSNIQPEHSRLFFR
jgi:hypothetical protein